MKKSQALYLVRKFEEAVRVDEIRGSLHPDDRDDIHEHYKQRRKALVAKLEALS